MKDLRDAVSAGDTERATKTRQDLDEILFYLE